MKPIITAFAFLISCGRMLDAEAGSAKPNVLLIAINDLPPIIGKLIASRFSPDHDWFVKTNNWRKAVQAYLACQNKMMTKKDCPPRSSEPTCSEILATQRSRYPGIRKPRARLMPEFLSRRDNGN